MARTSSSRWLRMPYLYYAAGRRAAPIPTLAVVVSVIVLQLTSVPALAIEPTSQSTASGMPSTATEEFTAYQAALLSQFIPAVQSLPGYVDGYFDHASESQLVVQFEKGLEPTNDVVALLSSGVAPSPVVESVDYSADQIAEALREAWTVVPNSVRVQAVSYDTAAGSLAIEVAIGHEDEALIEAPEEIVGIPVIVVQAGPIEEVACSTRENCYSPMKAGTVVRKGSTSGSRCTMGFHVQVGTDEQFVTAGHCGYTGANSWYHQGYPGADCSGTTGCVGFETATQYGPNGRDIMRVQMNDAQDSNVMWAPGGSSSPVGSVVDPMQGMWTCATRGVSESYWGCGWLAATSTSWTGDACGCTIFGARTNIGFTPGDSGSPIVVGVAGSWRALGIANTSNGNFARVEDALSAWGITIRQ